MNKELEETRLQALRVLNEHFRHEGKLGCLEDRQVRLVLDAMVEFRQFGIIKSVCLDCSDEFEPIKKCPSCHNNNGFPM